MGLKELCQKYFKTSNLYEVLQISEDATDKEVKKAYYRLSLKLHPDRVDENEKLEATEKFKIISSVHSVLSDPDKRATYNLTKIVEDDDFEARVNNMDWSAYWKSCFKNISDEDIIEYEKNYSGSELEKEDIKLAYLKGKGDMDFIWELVPFARVDTEPRIRKIIKQMIKDGEVPSYDIFENEPAEKRRKRHAKQKREAKEIEKLKLESKSENGSEDGETQENLEMMIKRNQQNRSQQLNNFFDTLEARYGAKQKSKKAAAKLETSKNNDRRAATKADSSPKSNKKRKAATKTETAPKNKKRKR